MKILNSGKIQGGQDGAIWNDFLFRFDHKGLCFVYEIKQDSAPKEISSFTLDRAEEITPHSNSVMFGAEYLKKATNSLFFTQISITTIQAHRINLQEYALSTESQETEQTLQQL